MNLTNLIYHIVFCPKGRQPVLTNIFRQSLFEYMGGIVRRKSGILIKAGGVEDHIHLLARFQAKISVSEMLKQIKGSTSHWINKNKFLPFKFSWQDGFSAYTISEKDVKTLIHYLTNQERHHRSISFFDELKELSKVQGILIDDFVWS